MKNKVPITVEGYEQAKEDLQKRIATDRPRIVEEIAEARARGDLSENAEYQAAKEAQAFNEGQIAALESLLGRAEVIDVSRLSGEKVVFGACVTFVDEESDEEKTYQIVGDYESSVEKGKIAVGAPVARAMIGKSVGDSFEVRTPAGRRTYEVLKIHFTAKTNRK